MNPSPAVTRNASSSSPYPPSSSPIPLLPTQPALCHNTSSPSVQLLLLNGHTGLSQAVTLPSTAPVTSVLAHILSSGLLPSASAEVLLLLSDGTDASAADVTEQPLCELLKGGSSDGQPTALCAYSRELVPASSSPTTAHYASPAAVLSLPLSSVPLAFTPPATPLSQLATAYPRLSASPSVVLRSLPDYVRIFSQQLAAITAAIEHIDHTVHCTRATLQQLAQLDAALAPLRKHTQSALTRHTDTTRSLWQQWQQLGETQQAALDTFEPTITALARIPLPIALKGGRNGSTLLECVDERALRDSVDKARRDKDKGEVKRHEARRQEEEVRATLEAVKHFLPQEEEQQVRAVLDGWSGVGGISERRRDACIAWMNRVMEARDEAQQYCQLIEARLQSTHTPPAELEREVRVKQMEMEALNRRNREEKEAGMYNHVAVYKHAATQLLSFATSLFAHHGASLQHCFVALSTLSSLSASLPLYRRLLTHSTESFAPLVRLNRLSHSYSASLVEVQRRQRRRQRRQKQVTAVVERWRREEGEEREQRGKWWQEWGVNLPLGMQMGLKEDSGWVKVEVCDWDGLLPAVTEEEVRRVREEGSEGRDGEVEETKEERKEEAEVEEEDDDVSMREKLRRVQAENAALKDELRKQAQQQPQSVVGLSSPSTTLAQSQPAAAAATAEELSKQRLEVDRRQALLNDANKTNAWLEEELERREEELKAERARRDKSDRDSREVAMKLMAHVKERTREKARTEESERERAVWQERCSERVTLLQPAVNDMVMAVRTASADVGGSGGSASMPVYRVRLAGESGRPMFLSAETMSVLREKRSGDGSGGGGAWPEWVVGHVVELVGKRATGTVRESEAGMKIGEEYWMATVALVDFSERHSDERSGSGENSGDNTQSASSASVASSASSSGSLPSVPALDALLLATP